MSNLQNPITLNSPSPLGFWDGALGALARELSPQQFKTWIQPLNLVSFDESEQSLVVGAPNRFKLDWIKKTFSDRLQELADAYFGRPINLSFVLSVEGSSTQKVGVTPTQEPIEPQEFVVATDNNSTEEQAFEIEDHSKLTPNLTFDTFVTGKANQLARAASIQVAHNPGTSYNPMFLYGGVGLGKTHLIHAIGNHLLKEKPNARIRYIHAEQYVSDVVRAYQQKAFDRFKRYYHSLDLLLIDDIQFFADKKRTQEELFYAFETLVANRSQIILTSDTFPKDLEDIENRLVSRFSAGLIAAIDPPELEMRVAILQEKAKSLSISLQEDVAFYIAKNLRSNIRELEGALHKLLAYSRFQNSHITLEMAKTSLRDVISGPRSILSVETIQKIVADYYKVKLADLCGKRRLASIVLPRQVAMYLIKELTQKSLPDIGEAFGGRDHTTVLHAVRKIALEKANNPQLSHQIHVIQQTLGG